MPNIEEMVTTTDVAQTVQLQEIQTELERLSARFRRWAARNPGIYPHIVILGAGYAGVTTAVNLKEIAGRSAQVTVVNRNRYHYLTTLLHQSAVETSNYREIAIDLPTLLGPRISLIEGEVRKIDPKRQCVHVAVAGEARELEYDYLVVALGFEPQFYGIPGVAEHALTLKDLTEARLIKNHIERQLIAYTQNPQEPWRTHIVIGGGAFTGVELAGELADMRAQWARGFHLKPDHIKITLIEGAPTILAACEERVVQYATAILQEKGVRLITGRRISAVESRCVQLDDGQRLETGTFIWTGGIRGHHLVEASGFAVNRQGRAIIDSAMRARDFPNVYIIGDASLALDPRGQPLPPTAQVAVLQGETTANNLRRLLQGQPPHGCHPEIIGTFVSLGKKDAFGVIQNRYYFRGWAARLLKKLAAYHYLYRIGGLSVVASHWGQL